MSCLLAIWQHGLVSAGTGPMGLHSATLPITLAPTGAMRHPLDGSGSLPGPLPADAQSQVQHAHVMPARNSAFIHQVHGHT